MEHLFGSKTEGTAWLNLELRQIVIYSQRPSAVFTRYLDKGSVQETSQLCRYGGRRVGRFRVHRYSLFLEEGKTDSCKVSEKLLGL